MKKSRSHLFFSRLFCLLMALYVFNFSVDPPDSRVRVTIYGAEKENLSVNEMESIGEWILENMLGLKNAIPEQDESDECGKIVKLFFYWIASGASLLFLLPLPVRTINRTGYTFCAQIVLPCYAEVMSPPPWLY